MRCEIGCPTSIIMPGTVAKSSRKASINSSAERTGNPISAARFMSKRAVSSDDVTAEMNYWGSIDEVDIRTGIYDNVDNAGVGTVDYSPWYDATFMTQYNTDTDAPSITINNPMDNTTYAGMIEVNATVYLSGIPPKSRLSSPLYPVFTRPGKTISFTSTVAGLRLTIF